MKRDTLTGFLFILVGDNNDKFEFDISKLNVKSLIFETDISPNLIGLDIFKYKFVTSDLFKKRYLSADYLFKWSNNLGSIGVVKNDVHNSLRRGEHIVCSLTFDVVKYFINNRQIPKKNYILINVSTNNIIPKGFDKYSFDLITTNSYEVEKFILRHL